MKNALLRLLVLFALLALQTFAADKTGTFSFLILKEGKPLSDAEVAVDNGAYNFITDQDGYLSKRLPVGKHTMQVIGRENGRAVVFARKPFEVLEGQDTQIILTLEAGEIVVEDIETPEPIEEVMDEEKLKAVPKGTLTLKIVTAEENKSVEGARIFVKGTTIEAKSGADGTVTIELPEGSHTLSVIHGQYSSQTLSDIKVEAGKVASRTVEMTPASLELEEFIVLVPNIQGSIASAVAEQRESTSVADILGAEQFSKRGDGDAAAALKRVSGLTLVDGKNIYVRGLGERYANVQLNGLSLPSPDPVKRVVPLDIFPAGVIGSLKVQKSVSPDIPGAFGGGYIDIRTKKPIPIPKNVVEK